MLRLLPSLALTPVLPQTLPVALPLLNAVRGNLKDGGAPQPQSRADDPAVANWSLAGMHNTVPRLSLSSITATATRGFATTGIKEPGTISTRQQDPLSQAGIAPHAGMTSAGLTDHRESFMEHPAYKDMAYLENIKPIHKPPKDAADRVGMAAVNTMRWVFDRVTGYGPNMTPAKWLQRIIFLETVAGVPGMVAGMLRHLSSLRRFQRDAGWIHTLLEEAENERMHLLTFLELRKPGILFRTMVILAQGVFFNAYFISYLIWPRACHSFVGYLEEEAVRTYTHLLKDIDEGKVWSKDPAPPIAITYWGLKPNASMRDLILAVRADEACHSHVNHTLKTLKPSDPNPFALGKSHLP